MVKVVAGIFGALDLDQPIALDEPVRRSAEVFDCWMDAKITSLDIDPARQLVGRYRDWFVVDAPLGRYATAAESWQLFDEILAENA